jgi:membrane fusion protein, heavy metal efflux system
MSAPVLARFPAAASLLVAMFAAGCSRAPTSDGGAAAEPSARRPPLVAVDPGLLASGRIATTQVTRRAPESTLLVTGEVIASAEGAAEVGAPVSARVASVSTSLGAKVKKGDPLAVLQAGEAARVAGQLAQARARRERAERVLEQEEWLLTRKATSERAVLDARRDLREASADERLTQGLLGAYGSKGTGRITLLSPIEGVIVFSRAVLGAQVEEGAKLFRMVAPERLIVRADVPESAAKEIALGARASFRSEAVAECGGTLEGFAPAVEAERRTVPFRVRPAPDCRDLIDGAYVDVTLQRSADGKRPLAAVPRAAVVEIEGVPVVFVDAASRARTGASKAEFFMRTVRVHSYAGDVVFIEDGVRSGEQVVSRGALLLKGERMRSVLE